MSDEINQLTGFIKLLNNQLKPDTKYNTWSYEMKVLLTVITKILDTNQDKSSLRTNTYPYGI